MHGIDTGIGTGDVIYTLLLRKVSLFTVIGSSVR